MADLWTRTPDIPGTLKDIPDDDPILLLTHSPDVFPDIPARVSLTLAGHTHGGQVNLPLVGRPIVPSKYGQRYAAGHIIEQGRHLFVSTGVGTSIIPVRFRVPPEIQILTVSSSIKGILGLGEDFPTIPEFSNRRSSARLTPSFSSTSSVCCPNVGGGL